jgi:integrase
LRRGNLRNLTWDHIVDGELRLPASVTKNGKPLVLPLTGRLAAVIERRRKLRVEACPFVFHRHGKRLGKFPRVWKAAAAAIGLPGLLLHDMRRSGARTFIRAGVPEDVVLKLGNWKTRSMLQRYNVVSTDDLVDAQAKLNDAFAAVATPIKPQLVRAS